MQQATFFFSSQAPRTLDFHGFLGSLAQSSTLNFKNFKQSHFNFQHNIYFQF
jgi:hypothetical protein